MPTAHPRGSTPDSRGDVESVARSPLGLDALRMRGDRIALVADNVPVSARRLAELVGRRVGELGRGRRLVAVEGTNDLEFVVTFLAALGARHVLLVLDPSGDHDRVADRYQPDVTVRIVDGDASIIHAVPADIEPQAGRLHPDLALLLSTSGSTGATKLVRLSRTAVLSNAVSIGSSLGLTGGDRAITSLPLHYCYGLSVLTSHLAVGASVVLTDTSVVDPCFRSALDRWGVTNLAGVPYTFELLERLGLDVLDRPSLRFVTQAGGRLDESAVARIADAGRSYGWQLFVMYGQTEATARIAVLPPDELRRRPGSVGRAIPGGALDISVDADADAAVAFGARDPVGGRPTGDAPIGEIVYRGPNVMMGYATASSDLARGSELDELRTGDIGHIDVDGFLHVVGRASRFVKVYGKRVDLEDLAARLDVVVAGPERCDTIRVVGDDDGVAIAWSRDACVDVPDGAAPSTENVGRASPPGVEQARVVESLRERAASISGLPRRRVAVAVVDDVPRTSTGKVDARSLTGLVRRLDAEVRSATASVATTGDDAGGPIERIRSLYAEVLGVPDVAPDASFASVGGDSLNYVETSIRLEPIVGDLPPDWHLRSAAELASHAVRRRRSRSWGRRVDTSVVVRAAAIALIVCTHMRVFRLAGGAHALVAVIGFNAARFHLGTAELHGRVRRGLGSIARVAVPTSAWIGINMVLAGGYGVAALFLLNNYLGSPERTGGRWEYWYFEAFVQISLVLVVLVALPPVRAAQRRSPYALALAVTALTIPIRFEWVSFGDPYNEIFRPHTVACFAAVGWLAAATRTTTQRLATTALAALVTFGYFDTVGRSGQFDRELRIFVALALLIWLPTVRLPRPVALVVGWVAAASMWIFLVHWQVWPMFTPWLDDRVAWVLTMSSGIAVWAVVDRILIRRSLSGVRQRMSRSGRSTSSQVRKPDTTISTSESIPVSA